MPPNFHSAPFTIFLYTEEQRGNQLVESAVVGQISDFSGSEKFIVVQDPNTKINFVYRVDNHSDNLYAVTITRCTETDFVARQNVVINGATFKLRPAEEAFKLLRGKTRWIQDKGSILSVLLRGAATNAANVGFARTQIERDRLDKIPAGVHVEYLRDRETNDDESGQHLEPDAGEMGGHHQ